MIFCVCGRDFLSQKSHEQKQRDEWETDELCKVLGDSFVLDVLLAYACQEMRFEKQNRTYSSKVLYASIMVGSIKKNKPN